MNKYNVTTNKMSSPKLSDIKLSGPFDDAMKKITEGLFLKLSSDALVSWFKDRSDPFAAGEFFGKILRAAANICAYTGDERLRAKVDDLVRHILALRDGDGCISTVKRENQPNGQNGSDLWERKYVLLGLFEYYDNFGPTLDAENDVLDAMISLAVYTASQVGDEPGKTKITETGWAFCGIESSSILEPVMKLFLISGNKKLFDFGEYIVRSGACSRENIFKAALEIKSPYKVGSNGNPKESIAKAYEMMSCFEGLLEYYRATGSKNALKASLNMIDGILAEEITLLGSGGGDAPYNLGPGKGEQWNRTKFEQTNPDMDLAMETCVTVTYIKLLYKAFLITGDVSYVDRIEVSLYNALLGAISEDGSYFEYFPKFNGNRRVFDNFSYMVGDMRLSCCTANGPMGLAVIPKLAVTKSVSDDSEVFVNLYVPLSYKDPSGVAFSLETRYPEDGKISVKITSAPVEGIGLNLRIPDFCEKFGISEPSVSNNGYLRIAKNLFAGDEITLDLFYSPAANPSPLSANPFAEKQMLFTYGPCVLAADVSYGGDVNPSITFTSPIPFEVTKAGAGKPFTVTINGKTFVPYYAAGRSFDDSTMFRSWFTVK